ncbi:hypothetical protein K1Y00_28945, partial [Klebsiella pneumoniae subsp. pneumoniae]|nr:hypothetical protein [Klebsiella pneumoniae subsp. pneumoniae]
CETLGDTHYSTSLLWPGCSPVLLDSLPGKVAVFSLLLTGDIPTSFLIKATGNLLPSGDSGRQNHIIV